MPVPEFPELPESFPPVAADTPAMPPAVPIAAHAAAIAVVRIMSLLRMVLLGSFPIARRTFGPRRKTLVRHA